MSYADSNSFSVAIETAVVTGLPAWLVGAAVNEWIAIPGTAMRNMDLAPLVTAGLCDPNGSTPDTVGPDGYTSFFGVPYANSALYYFGGALREANSALLLFGGGGARAWAGNEVRALVLEDDAPRWVCHSTPTNAAGVWLNSYHNQVSGSFTADASTPYMRDGITPNSRHAYWQPQFIDSLDRFYAFGCDNVWQTDAGQYLNVDSMNYATAAWNAPGTHPNIPGVADTNSHWIIKHPTTEKIYNATSMRVYEFDPQANTWSTVYTQAATDLARRGACIDPTRDLCLTIGLKAGVQNTPVCFDMSTTPWTEFPATFTGSYASSATSVPFEQNQYWSAGFVYCPDLDCFLLYPDDGYIYTITFVSNTSWSVDRLTTTGTGPTALLGAANGAAPFWGKIRYVPNLKGVVIPFDGNNLTYFIRTG